MVRVVVMLFRNAGIGASVVASGLRVIPVLVDDVPGVSDARDVSEKGQTDANR